MLAENTAIFVFGIEMLCEPLWQIILPRMGSNTNNALSSMSMFPFFKKEINAVCRYLGWVKTSHKARETSYMFVKTITGVGHCICTALAPQAIATHLFNGRKADVRQKPIAVTRSCKKNDVILIKVSLFTQTV